MRKEETYMRSLQVYDQKKKQTNQQQQQQQKNHITLERNPSPDTENEICYSIFRID